MAHSLSLCVVSRHLEDCVLGDVPFARVAALKHLERLTLRQNVLSRDAPLPLVTHEALTVLQSRSSLPTSEIATTTTTTLSQRCPDGFSRTELSGVPLCAGGAVVALERRLATNSSNLRSENATTGANSTADDKDDKETTKSIYVLVSFAGPALYFLYKLVLYVYFYCTYTRHERTLQTTPSSNKASGRNGTIDDTYDDSDDRRTTEKESTGSPPDSLVLPPTAVDQRRFPNVSFWVDEELQDWRMDFSQVKRLKCLTTTTNQKRRLHESATASVLSGCEVWLGTFAPQGAPDAEQPVVLKWIPSKQKEVASPPTADKFKGEIKRLAQLSHPNVVKFFGIVWSVDTHLVAVTEYMARGDLRQYLHRSARAEAGRWTPQKVQILLDVANVLLYLHTLRPAPVVHGNCNSRNVLLNDRMKAKLSDFGAPKDALSERELLAYSAVGSGRWISPEALMGRDSRVATVSVGAADVYSLGILMSEVDTHELPFSDLMQANRVALPETDVLQLIAKGALSPTLSPSCPPRIRALIGSCTAYDPKSRPSSRHVVDELEQILSDVKAAVRARGDSHDSDDDSEDIVRSMKLSRGVVV